MKFLMGLILGLAIVFLLGATEYRYHRVELLGEFAKVGTYQSTFSGVSDNGDCYLAITDTKSGQTEIFGITKDLRAKLSDKPFQAGKQGSVIVDITLK